MNSKEHKAYLDEFKKWASKVSSSKDEAQKFLVRSGIYDSKNQLSKSYSTQKH